MKTKAIILGSILIWRITAVAAPSVISGDLLNIGNANVLLQTSSGFTTFNSIAGGQVNTNTSHQGSIIAGGSGNSISTNILYSTIGGGDHNVAKANWATIGGGQLNRILTTNGLPAVPGTDQNSSEASVIAGGANNVVFPSVSVISGGRDNTIEPFGNHSVISGGGGNLIGYASGYSTISGGTDNKIVGGASWAAINGGAANEIEYLEDFDTNDVGTVHGGWIGGGIKNYIKSTQSVLGSIGGGYSNTVQGYASTIAGGYANLIDGDFCVIPGGLDNFIETNSHSSVIGGGRFNKVQKSAHYSVISGGIQNIMGTNSDISTIGGGQFNKIANDTDFGTIPGGYNNVVEANYGFAAGYYAKAAHVGAFVWSDTSSGLTFASTNNNEFALRAHGGLRFETGSGAGVVMYPNGSGWSAFSDRALKENFKAVDGRAILEQVAALPLTTWNYKAQGTAIRHIGPMAQDFKAAFGVGESERTITTIDVDGVALAAIQGLHQLVKEKDATLKQQQKTVEELSERLRTLEKVLLNHVSTQ